MATAIEMNPIEHATKVTDFVRIDDDMSCTLRVSDDGTPSSFFYNFSGIPEGEVYTPPSPISDNIAFVRVTKDGANTSVTIQVKMYYAAGSTGANLPRAWIYGQAFTNPDTADTVKMTFTEDDLDPSNLVQSFPLVIWNPSQLKDAAVPAANTATSDYTVQRLYTRLGTLEARREHIKNNLLTYLNDPNFTLLIGGAFLRPGADAGIVIDNIQKSQSFIFWMELMTRAISIDSNFDSEMKFNLLNGDTTLPIIEVSSKMINFFDGQNPKIGADRSAWTFRRLGTVSSQSPFTYTKPVGGSGQLNEWSSTHDLTCTLTGADVGDSWLKYLRS